MSERSFVRWFRDLGLGDVPLVGGKNASLGELVRALAPAGVRVPDGFAITAEAYRHFLVTTGLATRIPLLLQGLDTGDLTLGVDRDSEIVAHVFDERDPAVERLIAQAIREARRLGRKIGLCGQAPSDYPEFAQFLVECGIDSMSLNPDAVVPVTRLVADVEAAASRPAAAAVAPVTVPVVSAAIAGTRAG